MYPEFPTLLLPCLDLAGTAVFATSGALAAARARQTPLTFAFFAVVTGIGGSTMSDLLMGAPVSWVHHPTNIAVCLTGGGMEDHPDDCSDLDLLQHGHGL